MKKPTHQLTRSGKDYALVTDNAELKNHPSSVLSSTLNLELRNAVPHDGVAKGVVESSFRILQGEFRALIPGYVHKESDKRDGPDCRPGAVLAVEDLRK